MKFMLERAEPYIVKTESRKNQTCQSYRWKQVAMSDDSTALINVMGSSHRVIDRETDQVIEQTFKR